MSSDPGVEPRTEIARLVAQGRKVDAIRLVRDRMGMDLAEAEAYVRGFAEAGATASPPPSATREQGEVDWAPIDAQIRMNRKIGAIKEYRDQTRASLSDAKTIVEQRMATIVPGYVAPLPPAMRSASDGTLIRFLVPAIAILIIAMAIAFVLHTLAGVGS